MDCDSSRGTVTTNLHWPFGSSSLSPKTNSATTSLSSSDRGGEAGRSADLEGPRVGFGTGGVGGRTGAGGRARWCCGGGLSLRAGCQRRDLWRDSRRLDSCLTMVKKEGRRDEGVRVWRLGCVKKIKQTKIYRRPKHAGEGEAGVGVPEHRLWYLWVTPFISLFVHDGIRGNMVGIPVATCCIISIRNKSVCDDYRQHPPLTHLELPVALHLVDTLFVRFTPITSTPDPNPLPVRHGSRPARQGRGRPSSTHERP